MGYTQHDSHESSSLNTSNSQIISAEGQDIIDVPGKEFIADADMSREGQDLVLTTENGETIIIENYFSADPAPLIQSPDGAVLTGELVDSFVQSPLQFASAGAMNDASPVGGVEEITGEATVTRTDGTVETLKLGMAIYEGDVIETSNDGAVNIVFIDETSFAVSENARLAIDEYVFDPATESGTSNFSVLRGVFVFTSGLIGRDDPDDVEIDTPVGSIGIRGTIIAGNIQPGGNSEITVIEGAIVVKNGAAEKTLSLQFETVKLGGYQSSIEDMGVLDAKDVSSNFSGVSDVAPTLFSALNDAANDDNNDQGNAETGDQKAPEAQDAAPEQDGEKTQEATGTPKDGEPAPEQMAPENEASQDVDGSTDGTQDQNPEQTDAMIDPMTDQEFGKDNTFGADEGSTETSDNGSTTQENKTQESSPSDSSNSDNNSATQQDSGINTPEIRPLDIDFSGGNLADGALAGSLVARISTTVFFQTVDFSFANGSLTSSNGYFQIIKDGTDSARIVLTTAGEDALSINTLQTGSNFGFGITAKLADGRELTKFFSGNIVDPDSSNNSSLINLNNLSANDGIMITDDLGHRIGHSVSALGDVNGDGLDDVGFIKNTNEQSNVNIVYGNTNGLTGGLLPDLDNAAGNTVDVIGVPSAASGYLNGVLSNIGDFDGDGFDDYIVGHPNANTGGTTYIISGQDPSTILEFSYASPDLVGQSVSGIGDINNDGYADVIIGAPLSDTPSTDFGNAFIFYGGANSLDSAGTLGTPDQTLTHGSNSLDQTGSNVSSAGDFNGDGHADIIIGESMTSPGNGTALLYMGDSSGSFGTPYKLTGFNTNAGSSFDLPIVNLGDMNGDGKTDLMLASVGNDKVHFLFGGTALTSTQNINGVDAFSITASGGDEILSGGSAGDFNGDGFDDAAIIVKDGGKANIYVVYGKDGGFSDMSTVDLADPSNAFKMKYAIDPADLGSDIEFSVASAGDVNGDGFGDLIIGAPFADGDNGEVFVVYGRDSQDAVTEGTAGDNAGADALVASSNDEALVGLQGNDEMSDNGYTNVSFRGGTGQDEIKISNADFRDIDGGSGHDFIGFEGAGSLDFSGVKFEDISGIEEIRGGAPSQTITLSKDNIFNLLKTSDIGELFLRNSGDTGAAATDFNIDVDDIGNSFTDDVAGLASALGGTHAAAETNPSGVAGTFDKIEIGGYTLYIDQTVDNVGTI